MASKIWRARYYVILFNKGQYESRSTEDISDAHDEFNYFSKQPGITALGIYDPQDWSLMWMASKSLQEEHYGNAVEFAHKLRWE